MPTTIHAIARVPESELQDLIGDLRDFDHVGIVTAINDGQGTFTVEATVFDQAAAGGGGTIVVKGKMSEFGGPDDHGVKPDEGLALFDQADVAANPDVFLPQQPAGTSGTARRLNPDAKYIACRWDYSVTPRAFLKTAKVKVTNPDTNQTVEARPVDWGPNVDTGRAVDLSHGVVTALGLSTDKECLVEIPLPGGASQPAAPAGTPANADLAAIDSSIFPHDMTRTLAVMTTSNNTIFWVANLVGDQSGGQSLARHADGQTTVLLSDTTVFPVKASNQVPAAVADELNKAVAGVDVSSDGPGGNPPQPGDDINAKMFQTAQGFVNHNTSGVPLTNGGSLACAWCVNEVARLALGKPISTQDGHGNGLATADLFAVLKAHHTKLGSANDAVAGTIIIAPSTPDVHGHVGIVGTTTGGGATAVFSNSSRHHQFEKNYTIASFTQTFQHLQVQFFALKADQF